MSTHSLLASLGGGFIIGLAATLLLFFKGRIAGISHIVAGLWSLDLAEFAWRASFLVGLLVTGFVLAHSHPDLIGVPPANRSLGLMATSGFLVGFGAFLGNGCTSGHGVCGLGRRSLRSLVATLTFMSTGILTVAIFNHLGEVTL
jgi:uncharacterized membrane protein YedE/YeeE